jgi:hypothetical protein
MISKLTEMIGQRAERRKIICEETARLASTFRKKLNHFERENVNALGKLGILEPQIDKIEGENERLVKDNRRLERKNRALMEAQRVYEFDKKEADAEIQVYLEITNLSIRYVKFRLSATNSRTRIGPSE